MVLCVLFTITRKQGRNEENHGWQTDRARKEKKEEGANRWDIGKKKKTEGKKEERKRTEENKEKDTKGRKE